MLCHHITPHIKQTLRSFLFLFLIIPAIRHIHIDLCLRINGLHADGKSINASGHLGIRRILCRDITDLIILRIHAGYDSAEISRLINATKVVVKILAVRHITGSV